MNYIKIHNSIIKSALSRGRVAGYGEMHHIIPKSMGGTDNKDNLVMLTAREHFIIHWLLAKIHRNSQMIFALFAMTKPGNKSQQRYTSHSFAYAREMMARLMSERMSGSNSPMFGLIGDKSPNFGSKRTDEQRSNISKAMKGKRSGDKHHKSKRIKNLDTGEVFQSIRQAQLTTSGNVSYAVRFGGTADGSRFAYIDENGDVLPSPSKLKGYSKGSSHVFASPVLNVSTGERFGTINDAAASIGVTGTAISWAIKNKKEIKGFKFTRI